ncbi:hypothetical protein C7446_0265 [Kushneria sinocarnis]|uniref:Uncharacterized protein n=1 Tax=Kushneria sinocarnis TaxID=595502 RepID=A0A420X0S4_9GAMM|nr:hypothetical protein [Kushneria sinocarnis]RKR07453.1 hypothetical protein C7446_0265 [Kushneria sinocarnis]
MRPFDLLTLTIVLCALAIVIARPGPEGGGIVSDVMTDITLRYPSATDQRPLMPLHYGADSQAPRQESADYLTRHDPAHQLNSDIPGALSRQGQGHGGTLEDDAAAAQRWHFPEQSQPALLNYPKYTRTYSF